MVEREKNTGSIEKEKEEKRRKGGIEKDKKRKKEKVYRRPEWKGYRRKS